MHLVRARASFRLEASSVGNLAVSGLLSALNRTAGELDLKLRWAVVHKNATEVALELT